MHPLLASWLARGRRVEVGGEKVFVVDRPAARSEPGPTLLLLHGFPSCSLDFHRVLDALGRRHRVVAHDHLGFGLSAKPAGAAYSLFDQAELALELWRRLGVERGHLVAHDYGTSVATEILARREDGGLELDLTGVTLSNGSVLIELAKLRPSQRLLLTPGVGAVYARLASRRLFRARMRTLWSDPARADEEDLDALFDALVRDGGRRVLPRLIGYIRERHAHRERWVGALARCGLPVHLLWGVDDPVAVPAIARGLAATVPGARLDWLDGVGHYPMLEAPGAWADGALAFVDAAGR